MAVKSWMSWEGGVDVAGMTHEGLEGPNVIVHVARVVHTPVGSAPSGMLLYQPDSKKSPVVMGFVSTDPKVGAWFGPHVFAGTPFAEAPFLKASITVGCADGSATSRVEAGGHVFEVTLGGLGGLEVVERPAGALPFRQQGLEAAAKRVTLKVDGTAVDLVVPRVGLSGGPAAVWAPAGLYAR
jgi:hypothetical protein